MSFNKIAAQRKLLSAATVLLVLHANQFAIAGSTDIATAPLFTSSNNSVHSNILFILDDSGSMDFDYLPDDAPQSGDNQYGYRASQCNGVAYNPLVTYTPPVKYDGTSYPAATYPKALSNGYIATSAKLDLSNPNTSISYYFNYTGTQAKLNYAYGASGLLNATTTFYAECTTGLDTPSSLFSKVDITTQSAAQQQNYANWYSYYRTRLLMMKTSVGLAFSGVDAKYRVGFTVINNKTTDPTVVHSTSKTKFLDPLEFSTAIVSPATISQKQDFYNNLYAADANPYTPLRGALALAGQYYANKANGQAKDPIQYSCQKNFTILSTDGNWNTQAESATAPKFGPYKVDATTAVGEQDGFGTARPLYDGGTTKVTEVDKYTEKKVSVTVTNTPVTRTAITTLGSTSASASSVWSRNAYTFSAPRTNSAFPQCSALVAGNCTATVTTSAAHGFATGDSVTVAGVTPAAYNGTFTVTVISATQFTYVLTGQSTRPTVPTVRGTSRPAAMCATGTLTTQAQSGDGTQTVTTTSIKTTTDIGISSSSVTSTTNTPVTETITTTNGVITSDVFVRGSASVVTAAPVVTVTYDPQKTTDVPGTVTSGGAVSIPLWVNSGAPVASCAAASPSPNPSTAVLVSGTNTPAATVPAGSTTTGTPGAGVVTTNITKLNLVATSTTATSGGSTNSLADVAMYYYQTDLRDPSLGNCTGALGIDVCANTIKVPSTTRDNASYQHMTTFTLGLGNSGTLKYDSNYLTQSSGDYVDISQGTKNWPIPTTTATAVNIDDLWHAAVNGRGQFFSAGEPVALINSLRTALNSIDAITGAASAAATSTLQPVQGNNDIYVAQFTSADWTGDVMSYKISPDTGVVDTKNPSWSAHTLLDAKDPATRKIYYPKSGALKEFTYSNLTADALQGNFDNFCTKTGVGGTTTPIQCVAASTATKAAANSGANLVDYMRGVMTHNDDAVYRRRKSRMGDIINASPLFVGQPAFNYTENNYSAFKATTRGEAIYAAANDGMVHALDRATGSELWAYIPSFSLPNMYKLADNNYASNHIFLVDGSPVSGDIYDASTSSWKTILVGGLNAGGRGYYALDITTPASPKLLWEFSEADLGLSFGNPVISKLADGTWVVMFASGYNNVSAGDGNGHLYILNAKTGVQIRKIDTKVAGTAVGSSGTPSGLAKINAYVESDIDNTTKVVYGGDLLGNVWRFDINGQVQPFLASQRVAQLIANGKPQPITTRPALAEVSYNGVKYKVLYVGTGKYLGASDLANSDKQTIYALKDKWDEIGLGDVRASVSPAMVVQTATASTSNNTLTATSKTVDWANGIGWYMDLIGNGERVTVTPLLVLNALYVGTNIPNTDACTVGGTSWLYKLDIATGGALNTSGNQVVAVSLGNVLVEGMTNVQLSSKNVATIVTRSDGTLDTVIGAQPATGGTKRRTSWRVLK